MKKASLLLASVNGEHMSRVSRYNDRTVIIIQCSDDQAEEYMLPLIICNCV